MKAKNNIIVLEGRNMVRDALVSDNKIISVMISTSSLNDLRIQEIETMAKKKGIIIEHVRPEQIEHHADSGNPQGVIAQMELPPTPTLEEIIRNKPNAFILLFNKLDYEQNLGAILRSSWAAGVDAVVVTPSAGVHEITPVVAKVSQGGAAYVPLIQQSLFLALTIIRKNAIPVVGVEVDMGLDYTKQNLTGPVALVFGGESSGLTEPLQKYCDLFINIPMVESVASLNVSVATALIIFEKTRQERI